MKKILLFVLTMTSICVNAQDLIVPKTGDPIKAYNLEVNDKYYFYTLSPQPNGEILKFEKDYVLVVRKADGTTASESSRQAEGTTENNFPVINEEDIHGSLIAQGNCVFIPTNSTFSYERAGQTRLKELVAGWGYWTVVDKPEQAHFILQFVTNTYAGDTNHLLIRPRKYYREKPSLSIDELCSGRTTGRSGIHVNWANTNEDPERNAYNAERMFQHFKDLLLNKGSELSVKFFEHNNSALDADADNNNSSYVFPTRKFRVK